MLATYALDPRKARFVAGVFATLTLSDFINVLQVPRVRTTRQPRPHTRQHMRSAT